MSAPASGNMTGAAATGALAAAGTYVIVRYVIRAPTPYWRPALFSFLIEAMTHWQELPTQQTVKGKSTKGDAWALPSSLGWWVGGAESGIKWRDPADVGRESGFTQAAISFVITAVVWYVAARGFFNAKHNMAMWYAGVFGIIGGYGGYLQGDQPVAGKRAKTEGAYRLPFGGRAGAMGTS